MTNLTTISIVNSFAIDVIKLLDQLEIEYQIQSPIHWYTTFQIPAMLEQELVFNINKQILGKYQELSYDDYKAMTKCLKPTKPTGRPSGSKNKIKS
jgi:hypothetical protein